ncbi:putative cystathionine beta-lyase PatB [Catonella morbi ATCC 51271]|uniref:cysteine-S-conjugate beta-lyase n=2 Tax=Catonella TaxID=43996 RepID=V2Z9K5_9FIRM|nr:putative cystathionine beta-lyase PatB [Catonella morbi ATCC 51271]
MKEGKPKLEGGVDMHIEHSFNFDKEINRRNTNAEKWKVEENELPMWVADMDFEAAPVIRKALETRFKHGVFGYSGITDDWYQAYIGWWKHRHNFTLQKDWLIFTTGVVPAISSIVRKFTTPAEKVLIQTPVYNIFFNSILNNGRVALESPLVLKNNRYEMDFEQLEKDLSDKQTTLMILCNPQNPGGRIWTKEELIRVAELCKKYGVTVISDEVHCDLTVNGKKYVPFASVSDTAREISITCMSPGKSFNIAGLHTAAVSVPNEILRNKVNRGLNTDEVAEPNAFAIEAAVAAYSRGAEWLDALNGYLDESRKMVLDFIAGEIPEIKVIEKEATYLFWIDVRGLKNAGKGFAKDLRLTTGLYLTDGRAYGKVGEGFIRMNIACTKKNLKYGLERLKTGVRLWEDSH